MFFADFIQRLRPIIGDGRTVPEFVLFILKMVIVEPSSEKDSEKVTIINDIFNDKVKESRLKSYYYGKTEGKGANKQIIGDNINKLAQSIEHYLDTEKFKGCFKNLHFNYEAQNKLKDSFKDILADEANGKIVDRLADELKTIILKAAGSKNKATSSVNIVSDADGVIKKENTLNTHALSEEALIENWCSQLEPPSPNFSRDELVEIDALVKKIYVILKKLANLDLYQYIEKSNPPHSFLLSKDRIIRYNQNCIPGEKYNIFLECFKELDTLFIELKYYSELHKYAPLNEAANFFASINKDNYFLNNTNLVQLKLEIKLNFLSVAILHLRK